MTSNREKTVIYRHAVVVRLTHWINALCLLVLLMSGLQIFNAHPALYWGSKSDFDHPLLAIGAERVDNSVGIMTVFGHSVETTGILGVSGKGADRTERGFPAWITLPADQDLAMGRRWHLFFAWLLVGNGAIYLLFTIVSGHAWRDLLPSHAQLAHFGRSIVDHLFLRFHRGEDARNYNVLQKLSYLTVIFGMLPLIVLTGWTMSPGLDSAFPQLLALFGGRQSARTLHFIAVWLTMGFVVVHVLMVLVSGVWNNMRSMITGYYAVPTDGDAHGSSS